MPTREVVVDELDVLKFAMPDIQLRIACSKGTYIRSLANDIGRACGSGAYLSGLRRLRSGCFNVADANKMDELIVFLQNKL